MHVNERRLYQLFGESLRRSREAAGLTQSQLAVATGLLRTSVTNIEAGRQRPPLHVLFRLCSALHIEAAYVLPSVADVGTVPEDQPLATQQLQETLPLTAAFVQTIESAEKDQ